MTRKEECADKAIRDIRRATRRQYSAEEMIRIVYERYRDGGDAALEDTRPRGGKAWNRLPKKIRLSMPKLARQRPELSARELAVLSTVLDDYCRCILAIAVSKAAWRAV